MSNPYLNELLGKLGRLQSDYANVREAIALGEDPRRYEVEMRTYLKSVVALYDEYKPVIDAYREQVTRIMGYDIDLVVAQARAVDENTPVI